MSGAVSRPLALCRFMRVIERRPWLAGVVLAGIVSAPAGADETAHSMTLVSAGVFTEAQAQRGRTAYTGPCSKCHGGKLDGAPEDPDMPPAPPVAGEKFLRDWRGRSLAMLLEYTRATMPENNPGFLTDQEYVDIIAYMLLVGGAPPGENELEPDSQRLARFEID